MHKKNRKTNQGTRWKRRWNGLRTVEHEDHVVLLKARFATLGNFTPRKDRLLLKV